MAFFAGATELEFVPQGTDSSRGAKLISDGSNGSFWGYMGYTGTGSVQGGGAWRYRSIYTHGYLAAGYKGSNPWRSVNKTWHATDSTLYCGEQISGPQSYCDGFYSDYNGYIQAGPTGRAFNAGGDWMASYGLANGTIRMFTADGFSSAGLSYGYQGNDPKNEGLTYGSGGFTNHVGGMRLSTSIVDACGTQDIKGQGGWMNGGGTSTTHRMHFPTEVMYTGWDSGNSGRGTAAAGESRGYFQWTGTNYKYVTWSNSTWTSNWPQGGGWGKDNHCKIQSTKWGHHYIGTGNNVTSGKARFSDATGATLANFSKVRSYGEDNPMDGQDWGYIMGHYDGQQNNHTIKQTHSSDSEVTLGANAMPKGHYGQSSGACSTAAATVIGGGM